MTVLKKITNVRYCGASLGVEAIQMMLDERRPQYEAVALHKVPTDGLTPQMIANKYGGCFNPFNYIIFFNLTACEMNRDMQLNCFI